jgi:hypothetical protein
MVGVFAQESPPIGTRSAPHEEIPNSVALLQVRWQLNNFLKDETLLPLGAACYSRWFCVFFLFAPSSRSLQRRVSNSYEEDAARLTSSATCSTMHLGELVCLSKLEKLLARIRNNPKTVRFEELDRLLIRAGFAKRQSRKGSSHYYYTKDDKVLSVPYKKPYILETYVLEAIDLIGDYFTEDD